MERVKIRRKKTRCIYVGNIPIGGGAPIAVQSMTNTDTRDVRSTVRQVQQLFKAGCEIVRIAIPDQDAARAFNKIKAAVDPPLIADIHFDHRLAIAALKAGADGIRINPGNIGSRRAIEKIIEEASAREVPIRLGINAGSLPSRILKKYRHPTPSAMLETALDYIRLFENLGFRQMKISLKSSNVLDTISGYQMLSREVDYPLHLGVTEAGSLVSGTVKNALGIGTLLLKGIGDTIRVSLSSNPVDEVRAAYEILRALDLRHRGPEIISCPTCGRCEIDLLRLVKKVEKALAGIAASPKVAIMGCVVNGPGEAKEADIGIAGGRGQGILFKKGRLVKKVPEQELAETLVKEVRKMVN
ncbi:MAG: flavodoxin-dependent (E)-4-hydroxy-3-methylbut-2-enyl-diphosphate synthase [Deltaproteobacteria bacterium]|nr:flavodoxin-dependent (E)-4-hydroxy-3-methylbut-2-enyl-diphosphate synthase [Deltaproteobacteria bacterium]MBW2298671.1 flavodoxin-dependent (E)-4-hydroxy-3-methylbut-2-enyl-diphosphate synthase [Deltaproteobacteria bacterium]